MNNLKYLRLQQKLTQKSIAKILGIANTTYSYWENGKFEPDNESLSKLADMFHVSIDYLLGKTENPAAPDDKPRRLSPDELKVVGLYQSATDKAKKTAVSVLEIGQKIKAMPKHDFDTNADAASSIFVPVVGRAAAGEPIEMIEDYDDPLKLSDPKVRPGDFAVIASGNSMTGIGINDGDRVIIRPCPTVDNGTIALVAVGDGSTIKRFFKTDASIELRPENPTHKTQHYYMYDDIRILGRFIKVVRE
jgi:SOS-response transcriptional repressors (RecA-mediated autopeptidases)